MYPYYSKNCNLIRKKKKENWAKVTNRKFPEEL